jgi:hypothetical protein
MLELFESMSSTKPMLGSVHLLSHERSIAFADNFRSLSNGTLGKITPTFQKLSE